MSAICDAVRDYVRACFEVEAAVVADIQAGTITERAEVSGYAWPSATITTG